MVQDRLQREINIQLILKDALNKHLGIFSYSECHKLYQVLPNYLIYQNVLLEVYFRVKTWLIICKKVAWSYIPTMWKIIYDTLFCSFSQVLHVTWDASPCEVKTFYKHQQSWLTILFPLTRLKRLFKTGKNLTSLYDCWPNYFVNDECC